MKNIVWVICLIWVCGFSLIPAAGCSNKYFRQAMAAVGEEAAYAALKTTLTKAGLKGVDHLVDAVRLVAEKNDYGGAMAAFSLALEEHNVDLADKLTSRQVLSLLRQAEPVVKKASPAVAKALVGFCDYAQTHE